MENIRVGFVNLIETYGNLGIELIKLLHLKKKREIAYLKKLIKLPISITMCIQF